MHNVYIGQRIKIDWTILKGLSQETECFDWADVRVFLSKLKDEATTGDKFRLVKKGDYDAYNVGTYEQNHGHIMLDLGNELECGVYGLKVLWSKNGGRSVAYCERAMLFAVTQYDCESENPDASTITIKLKSSVATYGYDGMSAYELAVMHDLTTLSEVDWLKLSAGDTSGLEDRIEDLEEDVEELKGNIDGDLKGVGARVTSLEGRMTTAEGDIATLKNSVDGDLKGIGTRVSTIEGNVERNRIKIAEIEDVAEEAEELANNAKVLSEDASFRSHEAKSYAEDVRSDIASIEAQASNAAIEASEASTSAAEASNALTSYKSYVESLVDDDGQLTSESVLASLTELGAEAEWAHKKVDSNEYAMTTTDSEGKLIDAVTVDGVKEEYLTVEFVNGIKSKEIDEIKDKIVDEISEESHPEYVDLVTDANGKLLEATEKDGTKVFGGDVEIIGNIKNAKLQEIEEKVNDAVKQSSGNGGSESIELFHSSRFVDNCIGTMVHCQNQAWHSGKHADVLAKAAAKGGIKILRTNLSPDIAEYTKYGIEILGVDENITYYSHLVNGSSTYTVNWDAMEAQLKQDLLKYNGETDLYYWSETGQECERTPTETELANGTAKKCRINIMYWEFFNELDTKPNVPLEKRFELYQHVYDVCKAVRPEVKVVLGGLTAYSGYMFTDLAPMTDSKGRHIWDYFDIFNFHCYGEKPEMIATVSENFYKGMQSVYEQDSTMNYLNKKVWVTECNTPSYLYGDEKEAAAAPRWVINSLAYGVDKVFYFKLMAYQNFYKAAITNGALKGAYLSESFFALIDKTISNSYVSLYRNNGGRDALSVGSDTKKIYIIKDSQDNSTDYGLFYFSEGDAAYTEVKQNGLAIGGKGYTITKVSIINESTLDENVIYTGSFVCDALSVQGDSVNVLSLGADKFVNFGTSNRIKIYFSNLENQANVWKVDSNGNKVISPKLSYKSYRTISNLLPNGSTKPYIRIVNDIYMAQWQKPNGKNVYALWTLANNKTISVSASANDDDKFINYYNYIGERLEKTDFINYQLSDKPVYIENANNINY